MKTSIQFPQSSSGAYVGATFACLGLGTAGFLLGLWNAEMQLNEKGYYFTLLAFGLFAAVSLQYYAMSFVLALYSAVTVQKNVRDKKDQSAGGSSALE